MSIKRHHELDWHAGQMHHNWQFQKGAPRTAREAFGHSLDTGDRKADSWVFWMGLVCLAFVLLFIGCGK